MRSSPFLFAILFWFAIVNSAQSDAGELRGRIVDAESLKVIPARVYLQSSGGNLLHVQGVSDVDAVPYRVERSKQSREVHTSLNMADFVANLPAGTYLLEAEQGKEYFPASVEVQVPDTGTVSVTVPLRRWTNMAKLGWYSGETHVHRKLSEVPTLLLAEDLNVAFPLTAWVTDSRATPINDNKNQEPIPPATLIEVDSTHVIWPLNTEYEIFSVAGKPHTQGAVFVLNHREPLTMSAPPVTPLAEAARKQGAFLDLDKHNWPWSMMVAEQMRVDLFELSNNHIWRTDFLFGTWYPEFVGDFMKLELASDGFTEDQWIDFGFQTYYALLNCGLRMQPTGGTGSGVHPVPLGYGRVYVHVDGEFSFEKWVEGLLAGNSFVTTGPMLRTTITNVGNHQLSVSGIVESADPIESVELIVNGEVHGVNMLEKRAHVAGAYAFDFHETISLPGSSWVAVRTYARRTNRRFTFAHSAPSYVDIPYSTLRPTEAQRDYVLKRISDQIDRNRGILPAAATAEYEAAAESLRVRIRDVDHK